MCYAEDFSQIKEENTGRIFTNKVYYGKKEPKMLNLRLTGQVQKVVKEKAMGKRLSSFKALVQKEINTLSL